ncbi:glutathione S-transferase theta-1-like [Anoplophora glabripennis]|uniref:glutathione S-transferase theta-1-like n=1 Tax=Anoplophora glabripennis TaxID=217634 RepID=UPI000873879C|nr:glutathione S-transferase theta-1-like [Anoplophora glabripennis]
MVLKYYFDLMSQPSRALYIFLKLTNIPFEACPVALRKGEHLSEEFKKNFSKFQKVPFIHHGNFRLTESVCIFRYLTREYPVKDNWYPKDSKQQAKIDEYLEWQHLNTRAHCTLYFRYKWLQPMLTGEKPDPEKLKFLESNMIDTLDKFQELFISETPFINGQTISFADILAACEIVQPRIAGYDSRENRPKLKEWIEKVRNECNPYYHEAHEFVNKMIEKNKQRVQTKL